MTRAPNSPAYPTPLPPPPPLTPPPTIYFCSWSKSCVCSNNSVKLNIFSKFSDCFIKKVNRWIGSDSECILGNKPPPSVQSDFPRKHSI